MAPEEVGESIGADGVRAMRDAFNVIAGIGRDVTRIAVAAVSDDFGTFDGIAADGPDDGSGSDAPSLFGLTFEETSATGVVGEGGGEGDCESGSVMASRGAIMLTEELLDDGSQISPGDALAEGESGLCMSPHRMCRYSNLAGGDDGDGLSEIFGAHTDTSFVTCVPAAAVSGLEVYDEDAERWYRPELTARDAWEKEKFEGGGTGGRTDPNGDARSEIVTTEAGEEVALPWHCRYLVLMPGELMQLVTRNEVPATVHRVVAVTGGDARLSAPVLLRARNHARMNVGRYVGESDVAGELLGECDGMRMEAVHDAMQPSSFR